MRSTPCSVCGETLKCGTGTGSCWCKSFPPIMPLDFDQDCRCPACLSKAVDKHIDVLRCYNLPSRIETKAKRLNILSMLTMKLRMDFIFSASGNILNEVNVVTVVAKIALIRCIKRPSMSKNIMLRYP